MSTNHLSSFPLPSESVQSSCPYSLIIASHGLRRQGLRKPLTLFLFLAIIGAPRMDAFPPAFLWPQHVPQTLSGHMVTTDKRGRKTIYIPAESAGDLWKSIQIRAFNSFASERSRVRIPSGPPRKAVKFHISQLFCNLLRKFVWMRTERFRRILEILGGIDPKRFAS